MPRRPGRAGRLLLVLGALLCAPHARAAVESGRVVEVVDGDTLRVRPAGGAAVTVRLIGIDAPEKAHPSKPPEFLAEESTRALRDLCEGRDVRLEADAEDEDGYGRLLRYVYRAAPGPAAGGEILVNLEMLRSGHARALRRFPHSREAEFEAAEERARAGGQGVWADRGLAELRWLRKSGAQPVEIWPAGGGTYVVAHRGTAKSGVERGGIAASVEGALRLHAGRAGDDLARAAGEAGFLPESPAAPRAGGSAGVAPAASAPVEPPAGPAIVPWDRAARHVGETVAVEGTIVAARKGANVLFLNFHPNWKKYVSVVIPGSALKRFPADAERRYTGRAVRVTGAVALYKGRPEIVVLSPEAIVVLP